VDGFPFGGVGGEIDGDPGVMFVVGLVENVVEFGGVGGGGLRHLKDGDVGTVRRMMQLEVDSLGVFGHLSFLS